jgi:hypothetical protein
MKFCGMHYRECKHNAEEYRHKLFHISSWIFFIIGTPNNLMVPIQIALKERNLLRFQSHKGIKRQFSEAPLYFG